MNEYMMTILASVVVTVCLMIIERPITRMILAYKTRDVPDSDQVIDFLRNMGSNNVGSEILGTALKIMKNGVDDVSKISQQKEISYNDDSSLLLDAVRQSGAGRKG